MSDERAEVRAVLEAVSADLPPTRLTADGICEAGRRARLRAWPGWRLASVPRPSRRMITRVAAAAAALAVVPGLIVLALLRPNGLSNTTSSGSAGGGSAASPYTGGGSVASPHTDGGRPVQVGAMVVLSADGRTLTATVAAGVCSGPFSLYAAESPRAVELTATGGAWRQTPGQSCPSVLIRKTLAVRLNRPLGDRRVIDRATGRRLLVLDLSKVARVTYVPADYRSDGGDCRPPDDLSHPAGPATVPQCANLYSMSFPEGGGIRLLVTQYQGARPPTSGGPTWDPPTVERVHGIAAQLRLGHEPGKLAGQVWYTRELRWTERGVTVVVSSGTADSQARLLPSSELLRIADGVRW